MQTSRCGRQFPGRRGGSGCRRALRCSILSQHINYIVVPINVARTTQLTACLSSRTGAVARMASGSKAARAEHALFPGPPAARARRLWVVGRAQVAAALLLLASLAGLVVPAVPAPAWLRPVGHASTSKRPLRDGEERKIDWGRARRTPETGGKGARLCDFPGAVAALGRLPLTSGNRREEACGRARRRDESTWLAAYPNTAAPRDACGPETWKAPRRHCPEITAAEGRPELPLTIRPARLICRFLKQPLWTLEISGSVGRAGRNCVLGKIETAKGPQLQFELSQSDHISAKSWGETYNAS